MPFALLAAPPAERAFKKRRPEIRQHLLMELQHLQTDPLAGSPLKGKFQHLRSLHTRYHNADYRVAYRIEDHSKRIIVVYAASRENFYRQLERLPRAMVA